MSTFGGTKTEYIPDGAVANSMSIADPTITGNTTIEDTATVTGTLAVSGTENVTGTLNVTGPLSLSRSYLYAGRATEQTLVQDAVTLVLNTSVMNNGVSLNTSTGEITLEANKIYKLFATPRFNEFNAAGTFLTVSFVNSSFTEIGQSNMTAIPATQTTAISNQSALMAIYSTYSSADTSIFLRVTAGFGTATLQPGGTMVWIEEVVGL